MINLNTGELTKENLRALLIEGDDSIKNQIRVTIDGILFLSQDVGGENLANILFRLETFMPGNEYVGKTAAEDSLWVNTLFDVIQKNWPIPSSSYIDVY